MSIQKILRKRKRADFNVNFVKLLHERAEKKKKWFELNN